MLLMHTAGAEGSVALADTERDEVVAARAELPGRSASERLVPVVRELLAGRGWALAELAAVVVVTGPGSFTGVRVGLSAAKGLSEAGAVPLIGISRLALLAAMATVEAEDAAVHVVLDAGRGEFYYGRYLGRRCEEESLLTGGEVVAKVGEERVMACEARVLAELGALRVQLVREPLAEDAVPLAVERLRDGTVDDAALLDANYLRRTDTEILARLAAHGISV